MVGATAFRLPGITRYCCPPAERCPLSRAALFFDSSKNSYIPSIVLHSRILFTQHILGQSPNSIGTIVKNRSGGYRSASRRIVAELFHADFDVLRYDLISTRCKGAGRTWKKVRLGVLDKTVRAHFEKLRPFVGASLLMGRCPDKIWLTYDLLPRIGTMSICLRPRSCNRNFNTPAGDPFIDPIGRREYPL